MGIQYSNGPNIDNTAVDIQVPTTITSSQRNAIEAADHGDVPLKIELVPPGELGTVPEAQAQCRYISGSHRCEMPVRGGAGYLVSKSDGSYRCTGAFVANGENRVWMVTASHCFDGVLSGSDIAGGMFYSAEIGRTGGDRVKRVPNRDWAAFQVTRDDVEPWIYAKAITNRRNYVRKNYRFRPRAAAENVAGTVVCPMGSTTRRPTCTTIVQRSYDQDGIKSLARTRRYVSAPGDSGGPWIANGMVYGIHYGRTTDSRHSLYSSALGALRRFELLLP